MWFVGLKPPAQLGHGSRISRSKLTNLVSKAETVATAAMAKSLRAEAADDVIKLWKSILPFFFFFFQILLAYLKLLLYARAGGGRGPMSTNRYRNDTLWWKGIFYQRHQEPTTDCITLSFRFVLRFIILPQLILTGPWSRHVFCMQWFSTFCPMFYHSFSRPSERALTRSSTLSVSYKESARKRLYFYLALLSMRSDVSTTMLQWDREKPRCIIVTTKTRGEPAAAGALEK